MRSYLVRVTVLYTVYSLQVTLLLVVLKRISLPWGILKQVPSQ